MVLLSDSDSIPKRLVLVSTQNRFELKSVLIQVVELLLGFPGFCQVFNHFGSSLELVG